MATDPATAMEMVTAMVDMGLATGQADITVKAVMVAIGLMMGFMVVIAKGVTIAKVVGVIVPIKVGTALGAMEAMMVMVVIIVGILVIRVGGGNYRVICFTISH
jgi:hypothetical protein